MTDAETHADLVQPDGGSNFQAPPTASAHPTDG